MSKLSWQGTIIIGASVMVLISLFLPWVSVSDNKQAVAVYDGYTLSRQETATVYQVNYGDYSVYNGPPRFRMLVPILGGIGAVTLLLVLIAYAHARLVLWTSMIWGLLGLVGLGVILSGIGHIQATYGGIQVQCGFWAAVAGLGGTVLGALLTLPKRECYWDRVVS